MLVAKYSDHLPLYRQECIFGRAGEYARNFLGDWQGKLVCDDYSGYKAGFGNGITESMSLAWSRILTPPRLLS